MAIHCPWLISCVWLLAIPTIATAQNDIPASPESVEFFEREIRPLLLENCVSCHSQTVNNVKGGLNLDSRTSFVAGGDSGPAFDAEHPELSLLLDAVRRESLEMPPDKPLAANQVAAIEKWLKLGAPWPESEPLETTDGNWIQQRASQHWAWQPIQDPAVPVSGANWSRSPIDAFVEQRLADLNIQPSPAADPTTLLRRIHFDLIGLPPASQLVEPSKSDDFDWDRVVDQLLASPQFGVKWGRHWLDLMRYAETLGHEFDYPIHNAWYYRDAVINALNDDLRYDRMLSEHIGGDLLSEPRVNPLTGINESLVMTQWWWMGDSVHSPVDAKNDWATRTENQVDVFSKAFLGMTVACARCHDHKFDAIGMSDYYGLVGVAKSVRRIYCPTDPHGHIGRRHAEVKEAIQRSQSQANNAWSKVSDTQLRNWLRSTIDRYNSLNADELNRQLPVDAPLFAIRPLLGKAQDGAQSQTDFEQAFSDARNRVQSANESFQQWLRESTPLGDFSQGLPDGWTVDAICSEDYRTPPVVDWFESSIPIPARIGVFSSDQWGRSSHVVLRSPNFQITNRTVCLKLRGQNALSIVGVDGYFMNEFSPLLFADLRKTINQESESGWIVHAGDLNKYVGDPTYISLEAAPGSRFQIAEARLADRGPPSQPYAHCVKWLSQEPATRQAYEDLLIEELTQALKSLAANPADETENAIARAVLTSFQASLFEPDTLSSLNELTKNVQRIEGQKPRPVMLTTCEEGSAADTAIELRGNPHLPGDLTPRGCFQSLTSCASAAEDSSGRRELIAAMASPDHPLVARVLVNRVWYHLVGRGIVNSPDNFGVLGGRPTHPELLDYLTSRFVEHGWSIKWLIKEIVSSETYRLSSSPLPEHGQADPDGTWYSHRTVRRLDAEVLRDTILWTANSLDEQLAGPSVPVFLTAQMTGRGRPGSSGPLDGQNRRSAYLEVRRNFLNPFLLAFDYPLPSTTTGRRNVSNVPAQALGLLNDPLVEAMCERWVSSTRNIPASADRVATMIRTAFSRSATADEIQACLDLVADSPESGWIDVAHTLMNAKEFWYVK